MKVTLALLLLIMTFACSDKPREQEHDKIPIEGGGSISFDTGFIYQDTTAYLMSPAMYDSITESNEQLKIANMDCVERVLRCEAAGKRQLLKTIDSLKNKLFVSEYKHERIKYYNNIAKNPGQLKFLRGWINRVYQ